MLFGLVTFAKVKLHQPFFMIKSVIHWAMTRLIFVFEVGKLGGNIWLGGANQLVLWIFYNEKTIRQHFILQVTTLETWQHQYWLHTWFSLTNDPCRISPVENFKHERQNNMVVNMATLFARGILRRSSFLDNLKSSDKQLGLRRTPTWDIFFYCFSILDAIPAVASTKLVLDWNSWSTNTLLHHCVNRS